MKTIYADTGAGGTNWSCIAITDANGMPEKGGVVLKDLIHDGHHFAKEIRLIAAWVTVDVLDVAGTVIGAETTRVLLRSTGAMTASPIEVLNSFPMWDRLARNPRKTRKILGSAYDALDFKKFFISNANHAGYGLRIKYSGSPGAFDHLKNFEFDRLDVSQMFLFSHYGINPPHEPGGVLTAARFHPMIKYAFVPNPKFNAMAERRVLTSIRFDYRMQLYLDALHDEKDAIASNGSNVGVFRDTDILNLVYGGLFAVGAGQVEDVIFTGAEKPLIYELTAPGLAKGASTYPPGPIAPYSRTEEYQMPPVIRCWDNVHWWGGGVGKNIISTPGAFHAAHLHWRWGEITTNAPHGTEGHFSPGGVPATIRGNFLNSYGVLVDPQIWIQSVRFAVTQNDPKLDPDRGASVSDMSSPDWKATFQGLRSSPLDISNPSDIVLWYSVEVHRTVTVPSLTVQNFEMGAAPIATNYPGGTYTCGTHGTIFIHGLFFAHEAEKTSDTIGARHKLYMPTNEKTVRAARKWERTP